MEDFEHNGVYFKTNLSYPSSYKASDTPCRIRITPRDPKTGKAITKLQLRGSDSDKPAETAIFGRDIEDIRKNLFPPVADGIIAQMHLAGFLIPGRLPPLPRSIWENWPAPTGMHFCLFTARKKLGSAHGQGLWLSIR